MEADYSALKHKLVALLARREHSQFELKQKVSDFPEILQDQALAELVEKGLQSDQRFTEAWVQHRMNTGKGPRLIQQELAQKGIDRSLISDALNAINDDQWLECCQTAYAKKFTHSADTPKDKQKHIRFLTARGFGFDVIQQVIN